MKKFLISALAIVLFAAAVPAMATDSMHGSMMKPACPASDPVVGVNTMTKMYMTHSQMKAKMAGMTSDQIHAAMMKNHVKMMCMSAAKAMGAKPMSGM